MAANNHYPYVECEEHEGLQKSYVVCRHVSEHGAPVYHFVKCTDKIMGEICCLPCSKLTDPKDLGGFTVCCELGAIASGWTKIDVQ